MECGVLRRFEMQQGTLSGAAPGLLPSRLSLLTQTTKSTAAQSAALHITLTPASL